MKTTNRSASVASLHRVTTTAQGVVGIIGAGEILLEEFMKPLGVSVNRLARNLVLPLGRISAIVNGKLAITADTALPFGKYFRVLPQTWMG